MRTATNIPRRLVLCLLTQATAQPVDIAAQMVLPSASGVPILGVHPMYYFVVISSEHALFFMYYISTRCVN